MTTPIISIIIPTANRPQYLPRAVDSALEGIKPEDVEVIVVPNGPDNSWRESLAPYRNNSSVRVIPIKKANANIARNKGLEEASGEFVRFLDDDDYLIPEAAKKQYDLISTFDVDVVSGSSQLVDSNNRLVDVWHQPETNDLCSAVLGPWRNCLVHSHVYRKESIGEARWNPKTIVRQDLEWLFELCASKELRWKKTRDVVGIWQQHWGERISTNSQHNLIRKDTFVMLKKTYIQLLKKDRLNSERRMAISLGVWGCIQGAFFLQPLYWHKVSNFAKLVFPEARPPQPIYNEYPIFNKLSPLAIQWVMLPKRLIFYYIRFFWASFMFRQK